jgi:hypothetical protein
LRAIFTAVCIFAHTWAFRKIRGVFEFTCPKPHTVVAYIAFFAASFLDAASDTVYGAHDVLKVPGGVSLFVGDYMC